MQIVLYYCQASALVNYNTILFSEPIIPTSFGVVIESVWNDFESAEWVENESGE